jgi:predicted transcriptional regulator
MSMNDARATTRPRNNRGKIEIMIDIVNITLEGVTKTKIMYGCNLSYAQTRYYLKRVLECEFVVQNESEGVTIYRATEKGRTLVAHYAILSHLMDSAEKAGEMKLLTH